MSSEQNKGPSASGTFFKSEGAGILAGIAGGVLGGKLGNSSKAFTRWTARKGVQNAGKKIFMDKDAVISPTHLGSELGAHLVGGVASYAAIKHSLDGHKKSDNKYLQKAASLSDHLH